MATVGVSEGAVRTIWKREGLAPHRERVYLASADPDFERKSAAIMGLYLAARAATAPNGDCVAIEITSLEHYWTTPRS